MSDYAAPASVLWQSEPAQSIAVSSDRQPIEPASISQVGEVLHIGGDWIRPNVRQVLMDEGFSETGQWNLDPRPIAVDASAIGALDTLGCLALADLERALSSDTAPVRIEQLPSDKADLYGAVRDKAQVVLPKPSRFGLDDFVALFGKSVLAVWADMVGLVSMLGLVLSNMAATLVQPGRWRFNAFVTQLDKSAFRAVPIIILIQFVIGGIIAQQSAYQLRLFGAEVFAINLVAILVLREIGVLISAIMVAGRTGSAFTAEIGAMRMREEVDAMRVIGLDPVDVLVVPRVLGLIVALPLLTVIANASALAGGMLLLWIYSGVDPMVFIDRMHSAILLETVMVGFIKAPFMAMAIGCISCMEGFRVTGSTESLGRRVTAAVVKSIFAVIVMDGVFAIFFASIDY
jgi:phospholipid/cholesterol/gamma-HCH transport system permease protein